MSEKPTPYDPDGSALGSIIDVKATVEVVHTGEAPIDSSEPSGDSGTTPAPDNPLRNTFMNELNRTGPGFNYEAPRSSEELEEEIVKSVRKSGINGFDHFFNGLQKPEERDCALQIVTTLTPEDIARSLEVDIDRNVASDLSPDIFSPLLAKYKHYNIPVGNALNAENSQRVLSSKLGSAISSKIAKAETAWRLFGGNKIKPTEIDRIRSEITLVLKEWEELGVNISPHLDTLEERLKS